MAKSKQLTRLWKLYYKNCGFHPKTVKVSKEAMDLMISCPTISQLIDQANDHPSRHLRMIVRRLLHLAFEHRILTRDYGRHIYVPPQAERHPVWLDDKQYEKLAKIVQSARDRHRGALALALYAGLRHGEIASLQASPDKDMLTVTGKGSKMRTVPISNQLKQLLEGCKFPIAEGSIRSAIKYLQRCCRMFTLPVLRLHDLRAVFLTELARAGVRLDLVQMVAGHSKIGTTLRYYVAKDISEIADALNSMSRKGAGL